MPYSIIENWDKPIEQTRTFFCDERDDIATLPTDVPVFSKAFVDEDCSVWYLNNNHTWKEIE